MSEEHAVAVVEQAQTVTPMSLLVTAQNSGATVEQLQQLLELQMKWEANEARKAYNAAIAQFKGEEIRIIKNALVDFQTAKGRTSYKHATLAGVIEQIIDKLSKYGLSHSWKTSQSGNQITVTCRISHVAGHYEETSLWAEPDNSGNKNSIQAVASTVTYLERYTLKAALGLAEADDDDDSRKGETPAIKTVTEEQAHNLSALIAEVKADEKQFLSFFKAESVDSLRAEYYEKAVAMLEAKRQKAGQ